MKDYVAKTIEAYDAHAEQYGTYRDGFVLPELIEFMRQLPPLRMLAIDVGCGSGNDTAAMADAGIDVVGVDMSEKLLERAEAHYPSVAFRRMDMRQLDFPEEGCRGVWCNAALLHLNEADMLVALGEFNRVLAPGGLLVVSVKEGEGEAVIVDKFSSDGARYYNYETEQTLQDKLETTGFTVSKTYVVNERERFGPGTRDLNWVWAFATKN